MIIIGEKLNGAIPAVAKAIAERDAEFIRQRARAQAMAAQDEDYFEEPVPLYIDVCASTDPSVEVETLKWMIEEVEAAIPEELEHVAIAVDSPSAAVCAEAFKFCSRPGIVNSVSMEKDADGVVSELAPMCSAIYVTQPDSPRALPCEDLAETVRRHGRVDGVFRTIGEAMEAALDGRGDDNVLVTGSFRMAEGVLRWMAERSSRFSTRSQRSTWAERILAATRRV